MIVFLVTNEYQPESGGLSYSCRSFKDMLVDLGCDTRVLSSAVPSQYDILGGYRPSLSTEIALEEKFRKDGEKIPPKSLIISFGGWLQCLLWSLAVHAQRLRVLGDVSGF